MAPSPQGRPTLFLHRRSPGRLAVFLAVYYVALALGGSSLHGLLDRFSHASADGSAAHDRLNPTVSGSHSHACPLCDYLALAQLPTQRVLASSTEVVREIEQNAAPIVSPLAVAGSIQPRAPPR